MSAMTSNFGGKKAAPFRKGGKPRKTIVAKAVVSKAKRAKREMALSVITGREIDLGRDGSKWKHGWIPLNASAAALKAHKGGGHNAVGSREEHAAALTKHIKEASSKSRAASEPGNWYDTPTHTSPSGRTASIGVSHSDGKAYYGSTVTTAGGERMHVRHNSAKAAHEHVMNALYPSNVTSINRRDRESQARMTGRAGDQFRTPAAEDMFRARATTAQKRLAVQNHHPDIAKMTAAKPGTKYRVTTEMHNAKGEVVGKGHHIYTKAETGRWHKGTIDTKGSTPAEIHAAADKAHNSPAREFGSNKKTGNTVKVTERAFGDAPGPFANGQTLPGGSSDMSPQAKIDNAEKMYGTGSKQHLAALQRFGTESQKRAAAYQIREKSSPNNAAGKYEAQLKGTATASLQHLYAMRGTVGVEHKDQIAKELKRRGARLPKRGSNDVGSKE